MSFPTKDVLKRRAKKLGFLITGNFVIIHCGEDVISGIALDYAPHHPYLWTFALPKFDDTPFLHMTLGDRLVISRDSEDPLMDAVDLFHEKLSNIHNSFDLIKYAESRLSNSDYLTWVKYICLIRGGNFDRAKELERYLDISPVSHSIDNKYQRLKLLRNNAGWEEAQNLLAEWAVQTGNRFCRK